MNVLVENGKLKTVRRIVRDPSLCPDIGREAVVVPVAKPPPQPPVIALELARERWATLHRRAYGWTGGDDSAFIAEFEASLPCGTCRVDWARMMRETPPDWANYFAWTVDRHNEVAARIGNAVWSISQAAERWAA